MNKKKILRQGTAMDGMSKGIASNSWNHESEKYKFLSECQPVKIYTKEEIAAYEAKRKGK